MFSVSTGDLKVDDRVVIYAWGGCGKCGYCNHNEDDKCTTRSRTLGL